MIETPKTHLNHAYFEVSFEKGLPYGMLLPGRRFTTFLNFGLGYGIGVSIAFRVL